jgi:putative DNA primase/helicase
VKGRWEQCEQPVGDRFEWSEAEALTEDVYDRYDAGVSAPRSQLAPNARGAGGTASVDRYFDRHDGLRVATLAADVAEMAGPFALGPGDSLWVYRDGVYVSRGSEAVRQAVVELTGERHRASHLTNVEQVLKATHTRCRLPDGTELPDSRFLNLGNGLLDWPQSKLLPHSPDVASIHRVPVRWDPDARCPATEEFLRSLFGQDQDVLSFVEEIVGAVIYPGHPFHQRAVMLLGSGSNGKGVFLAWLRCLVGSANISAVKPQALDNNRFAAAQLYGKLANLAGDVAPTAFVTAERFKEVTAGDVIQAEHKYGQPFSFHPVATIVASFNEMPTTADRSDGFFRRWLVLHFPYRFVDPHTQPLADDERPRRADVLAHILAPREQSGFLVRAVAGLRRLEARGDFAIPDSVTTAIEKFREHADPLVAFLRDNYGARPEGFVTRANLLPNYRSYCDDNGHKPLAASRLYEHLPSAAQAALGTTIQERKRAGVRGFVGMVET